MNGITLFWMAVLCMVTGHMIKVKRWELFISVYEKPSGPNLLNAMSMGHTLNAVFPVRTGDIVRVLWAGRRMKNGYIFSLATVLADLYADVLTVGAIFLGLLLAGKGGEKLFSTACFYIWLSVCMVPLTLLCMVFRRSIKKVVKIIAGFFNENVEFLMLYTIYLCIASAKDMMKNISRVRFAAYSAGMWAGYAASYAAFAGAVQSYGYCYAAPDVFTELFSGASLYNIEQELVLLWAAYLLIPLAVCWGISRLPRRAGEKPGEIFRLVLPQLSQADRLAFLKTYYEEENREYIQDYLDINRDVVVIEDTSAGSNASTILVMKHDGNMYYRKYAFGQDGIKLQEQIEWIKAHQPDIPLPIITSTRTGNNCVIYDMHSYVNSTGLFRYIHTMPVEESWNILKNCLDEIGSCLHSKNIRNADGDTVDTYIEEKVLKNLKTIEENNRYIKMLEQNQYITINGKEFRTLKFYRDMLSREHLKRIFSRDRYSDIHGDLTVENIICISSETETDEEEYTGKARPMTHYFIDPNTGNIHDSPFLDYAKLLQSLHGNYEFLMMVTGRIEIGRDRVNYMVIRSEAYELLYQRYQKYLAGRFNRNEIISIYYHEAVHWLRLMPYKIRKNERLAVVFYTGLLTVLDEVWELEYGIQK